MTKYISRSFYEAEIKKHMDAVREMEKMINEIGRCYKFKEAECKHYVEQINKSLNIINKLSKELNEYKNNKIEVDNTPIPIITKYGGKSFNDLIKQSFGVTDNELNEYIQSKKNGTVEKFLNSFL